MTEEYYQDNKLTCHQVEILLENNPHESYLKYNSEKNGNT